MNIGFKTRTALIFAGWASALAVIFSVMFLLLTQSAERQLLADILAADAERYLHGRRIDGGDVFVPASSRTELTDLDTLTGGRLPEGFDPTNPEPQEFTTDDGRQIAAVSLDPEAPGPGRILMVDTTNMRSVTARIDRHLGQVAGTLLIVILLTAGISFVAARHISRPISRLSGVVSNRDGGTLSPGFSKAFGTDEVGTVAGALDASLVETRRALEREQTFNLGLSHELRSSLQSAEQSLELAMTRESAGPELDRLARSLMSMRRASEAVLWLSRPHADDEAFDPPQVEVALESLQASLSELAATRSITLKVDHTGSPQIHLPEEVLDVILFNLARNSILHSGGQTAEIRCETDQISIEDDGGGFTAEQVSAFNRGEALASSAGSGLGVLLSARLAERFGYRLELASPRNPTRLVLRPYS